jgi:hypothetical protein
MIIAIPDVQLLIWTFVTAKYREEKGVRRDSSGAI